MANPNIISPHIKIFQILANLYLQSDLERSGKVNTSHEDSMLAITNDTGKFLNILLSAINCNRILEIGTSVGYSTLWMALTLLQNKESLANLERSILTIEKSPSKIKRAKKNFEDAGIMDMVEIVEGNALAILDQLAEKISHDTIWNNIPFDFVFLDADKENLIRYFDLVFPLVRKGGLIVTDNILLPQDYKLSMAEYVNHVRAKKDVQSVTVPIGYGEEVSLKLV
jgi:predicted O-methyltransferase YrrM